MTLQGLLVSCLAFVVQPFGAVAAHANQNGECTVHTSLASFTIHDIDDACCETAKEAAKKGSPTPPPCIIGKNVSGKLSVGGHACAGNGCNVTLPPSPDMRYNLVEWYGLSQECCKFIQTRQPPVPEDCPPKDYCLQIEGTYTNQLPSADWHLSLARLAGDQVLANDIALALQPLGAVATHANQNSDCTVDTPLAPFTIHDIDAACCETVKEAAKGGSSTLPPCIIGKTVSQNVSVGGYDCAGNGCDLTNATPPSPHMQFNLVEWYGMSQECCKFFQTKQPPVPEGCPPKDNFCLQIEGTYTNQLPSADWHLSLARFAGDQVLANDIVLVV